MEDAVCSAGTSVMVRSSLVVRSDGSGRRAPSSRVRLGHDGALQRGGALRAAGLGAHRILCTFATREFGPLLLVNRRQAAPTMDSGPSEASRALKYMFPVLPSRRRTFAKVKVMASNFS